MPEFVHAHLYFASLEPTILSADLEHELGSGLVDILALQGAEVVSNQILKVLKLVEDHLLVRTVGFDGFDQGRDHLLGSLCCDASFS